LNGPTGGSEKKPIPDEPKENQAITKNPFTMPKSRVTTKLVPGEIKVERDPQTGRILRIVHSDGDGDSEDASARPRRLNPLNDLLQDLSDEEDFSAKGNRPSDVVLKLQEQADQDAAVLATKRRPRQQSKREEEWISILAEKYGDNTRAMARDVKLNPMQQSEGDLARRLKKWKANRQIQG
jgi:nucleolar protein 16